MNKNTENFTKIQTSNEYFYKHTVYAHREYEIIKYLKNNSTINVLEAVSWKNNLLKLKRLQGDNINFLKTDDDVLLKLMQEIGQALAKLHYIDFSHISEHIPRISCSLKDFITTKLDKHLQEWGGIYLSRRQIKNIYQWFKAFSQQIKFKSNYGFIHGDFCYQNILYNEGRICFIDFEHSCFAYQIDDLSRFCSRIIISGMLGGDNKIVESLEDNFLKGYAECGNFDLLTFEILKFVYLLRIKKPLQFFWINKSSSMFPIKTIVMRQRYQNLINKSFLNLRSKVENEK